MIYKYVQLDNIFPFDLRYDHYYYFEEDSEHRI